MNNRIFSLFFFFLFLKQPFRVAICHPPAAIPRIDKRGDLSSEKKKKKKDKVEIVSSCNCERSEIR